MGMCFLVLAINWTYGIEKRVPLWFGGLVLVAYAFFFVANGLNQLTFGTLQGKLIARDRRGGLLLYSNLIGVGVAITAVILLLPRWLSATAAHFDWIFGFTAACFLSSTLIVLRLKEKAVDSPQNKAGRMLQVAAFWQCFRNDRHLRGFSFLTTRR